MDGGRFGVWVQGIAASQIGRRPILHALVGGPLGGLAAALALPAGAKRRKKRKKKKVTFNAFGCVDVGGFCKNAGQCCSGICQGKKNKKTCQAHDVGGCQAGQDVCLDVDVACGTEGLCFRTTGNASFCGREGAGECDFCAKDEQCELAFGPGAACIVCATCDETGGTLCFPSAALA